MAEFIFSLAMMLVAAAALILTARSRKKLGITVFLPLIALEIMVILAAGWMFLVYGAVIEMNRL